MKKSLWIYNSLTRRKEQFEPLNHPFVGLYVCGPTVYSNSHLGHARPAITFDVVFRYLTYLKYKVRYVRNITDVGHLLNDQDEGEDKIEHKARIAKLEPMEIVQMYTLNYHKNLNQLNCIPPSIEPRASGHIIEQIQLIEKILKNNFAYVINGSVYFDVKKFNKKYNYGKLSGRKQEEMLSATRSLEGKSEKRHSQDFALWKRASKTHIMRWPSPWSDGFPGWHLECSIMSTKYLGPQFDIHGGGMDLIFPHHDCEIAQSIAGDNIEPVKYWMHNNMITINGQKMGKSLGNFITLDELFSGKHEMLDKAYNPMTIRFFILQAHYRSTLDFSNDALLAAEKGYKRLMAALELLPELKPSAKSTSSISHLIENIFNALNDDFNTPIAIAHLFECAKWIQSCNDGKETISGEDQKTLISFLNTIIIDVLGFTNDQQSQIDDKLTSKLIELLIDLRNKARTNKDFELSDLIRDKLSSLNINLKDTHEETIWHYKD